MQTAEQGAASGCKRPRCPAPLLLLLLLLLGLGSSLAAGQRPRRQFGFGVGDPLLDGPSAILGVPGLDYPLLGEVPDTGFTCEDKPSRGYYADVAAACQVFWICQGPSGRGTGFLCPNGTLFNQESLVCEWWHDVDCAATPAFYGVNVAVALQSDVAAGLAPSAALAAAYRQYPNLGSYAAAAALAPPAVKAALAGFYGPGAAVEAEVEVEAEAEALALGLPTFEGGLAPKRYPATSPGQPSTQSPSQYPSQNPSGNQRPSSGYPKQGPSSGYPTSQSPSSQYPSQNPSGNQGPSSGYPKQRPSLGYPKQGPSSGYPKQGPSSGYPKQGPSSGYPSTQSPSQYASQSTSAQGPSSGYTRRGPSSEYQGQGSYSAYQGQGGSSGYQKQGPYPSGGRERGRGEPERLLDRSYLPPSHRRR